MIQIIKIGGAILSDEKQMKNCLDEFSKIPGKKILVHGGGRSSSQMMRQLGMEPTMIDGRRVTDSATLTVVTRVYAGINKQLVAELQARNMNAIGLCGADGNILLANRRPPTPIDYGFVGDIEQADVNVPSLYALIQQELIPVFAALSHDGKGTLLNTNADTIASVLAQALQTKEDVRLIYTFEKKGLLRNVNDEQSLISEFSLSDYDQAKQEGFIHAGMIPKLDNAFDAKRANVKEVIICNMENLVSQSERTLIRK